MNDVVWSYLKAMSRPRVPVSVRVTHHISMRNRMTGREFINRAREAGALAVPILRDAMKRLSTESSVQGAMYRANANGVRDTLQEALRVAEAAPHRAWDDALSDPHGRS